MNKMINVAVVGTGFIGKQHLEALARLPYIRVVAVVESNPKHAEAFKQNYAIDHVFSFIDELYSLDELDAVHICTPNALHYPMAKSVLEHHYHVFCEKPLSLTACEAKELTALAQQQGKVCAVNLNYRSNAMVRELKARIDDGSLGDILFMKGEYIQDWLMFDTDYDWHFDPKLVGASRTVADIGTHLFDLIQFVSSQRIVAVNAQLIQVYPERIKREARGETFDQSYGDARESVPVVNEDAAIIMAFP